jgi:ribonuclease BN (tRNA processing enzyme)
MKIQLFGTGALVTKRFSACAMIDDTIMFDCPNGLVRKLRQHDVDFSKIQIVIISHYHADHDFDLPFLLWEYNRIKRTKPLTIIAPTGFAERFKLLFDLAWPDLFSYTEVIKNVNLNILTASDAAQFSAAGYKIQSFKMIHADCDAYGYKITDGKKTAAFTGDATISDNVNRLVSGAQMAFIDVTGAPPPGVRQLHFDVPMFLTLQDAHPKIRLIPTHMGDSVIDGLTSAGHTPPPDDAVFNL